MQTTDTELLAQLREDVRKALNAYGDALRAGMLVEATEFAEVTENGGSGWRQTDALSDLHVSLVQVASAKRVLWMDTNTNVGP